MKKTNQSATGTSYHSNNITATVEELIKVLGEPAYSSNDGEDKVNFEWEAETDEGEVFTVYDWKEYRPISRTEVIEWHIGAKHWTAANRAEQEIKEALSRQTNSKEEKNNTPLWRILNEQRTQEDWKCEYDNNESGQFYDVYTHGGGNVFNFAYNQSEKEPKANGEYTVLAVNNLQYLAEALEYVLPLLKDQAETIGSEYEKNAYKTAKEALKRIS